MAFTSLFSSRTAALACVLLLLLLNPDGVVSFSNVPSLRKQKHQQQKVSSSPSTTKLLQSSRILPSEEAAVADSTSNGNIINSNNNNSLSSVAVTALSPRYLWNKLQEGWMEYRHVRKQHKLQQQAVNRLHQDSSYKKVTMVCQGLIQFSKQFLYAPNKMMLQSYVLAHQQAQYDHLHVAHHHQQQPHRLSSLSCSTSSLDNAMPMSISQRLRQRRRAAKDAKLATKYAAMESLEDRAFAICQDLGMI